MPTTDDRSDPRLNQPTASGQNKAYLVLSEAERARGFVRPVRRTYVHTACGVATTMSQAIAETYARDPKYYGSTFCTSCHTHFDVAQFVWDDGSVVGS